MKISSIAFGVLALSLAAASNASPVNYSINGTSGTFGSITDTFSGPATLSKVCFGFPITLNCTLELDGTIEQSGTDPDELDLVITGASSTGGGGLITCSDVGFTNFNWTGSANHSALPTSAGDTTPVSFTVSTIGVSTPCGSCSGSVTATYTNTNNGEFGFNGSLSGGCSVSGSGIDSTSGTVYRVWH